MKVETFFEVAVGMLPELPDLQHCRSHQNSNIHVFASSVHAGIRGLLNHTCASDFGRMVA